MRPLGTSPFRDLITAASSVSAAAGYTHYSRPGYPGAPRSGSRGGLEFWDNLLNTPRTLFIESQSLLVRGVHTTEAIALQC